MENLIRLRDINKTYHLGEIDLPVLKGISMEIEKGEMVALMGVSGSGKSTLMNILGCLDRPTSGEYWLEGRDISRFDAKGRARLRNRTLGFVFQNFNLLPRTSALDNVMMPLNYGKEGLTEHQKKERAVSMLEKVGLVDRSDHHPSQALGRRTAARCHSALPHQPPTGAFRRRADGEPRFAHQRGDPSNVPGAQQGGGHHDHPRHARSGRGAPRGPGRPDQGRPRRWAGIGVRHENGRHT